jgi:hypothetical protein
MSYNQPPQPGPPQPMQGSPPPPQSDGWTTQRVLLAVAGMLVCLLLGLLAGLTIGDNSSSDSKGGTTVIKGGTSTVTQTETSPPTTVTETDTVTETETEPSS